jgi:single-stranded-DNA-specific exonuclease
VIREVERRQSDALAAALGVAPPVARLLVQRGFDDPEAAARFLNPGRDDFHDPRDLPDIETAVSRIIKALDNRERITVYGDYDADGVTSAALLGRVLRRLAADPDTVSVRVPNRHVNGYGLSPETVRQLQAEENPAVIITADCGISATEGADCARELGIDLVITDHHEPGDRLPDALAVVNPKRSDSRYPFRDLAGVGVAFKVGEALAMARGVAPQTYASHFLDLVTLGTVADNAPLLGENRALVRLGLPMLPASRKPGIRALINTAGLTRRLNAASISFQLAPRLNAVGRVDDAAKALELLMTPDPARAASLIETLERLNGERREEQERIWVEAQEVIHKRGLIGDLVMLVTGRDWHKGVIGIVAGRLSETYHRPALVAAVDGDWARGSARSAADFPMIDALRACHDLLPCFGGHSQAAGFEILSDDLEEFRIRLNRFAVSVGLDHEKIQPCLDVDTEIAADEIGPKTLRDLALMEPFGSGNPEPLFVARNLLVVSSARFGRQADRPHLSLKVRGEGMEPTECVWWRRGTEISRISPASELDVVFRLESNYLPNGTVRLNVQDARFGSDSVDPAFRDPGPDPDPFTEEASSNY